MSLETIDAALHEHLDRFAGLAATVLFDFGTEGRRGINATGPRPVVDNDLETPDCTLRLSTRNALKLVDGRLDPLLALGLGKVKIKGKIAIAHKLKGLLQDKLGKQGE